MTGLDVNNCTVQEACDYAVQMLVKQGVQCTMYGGCVFSNGQGHHCAVGWLLDHNNEHLMEFQGGVHSLIEYDVAGVPDMIRIHPEIFSTLQEFHDEGQQSHRMDAIQGLNRRGIDTSGEWWQQWVDMGWSHED